MTYDEWFDIAAKAKSLYPNDDRFLPQKRDVDTWYDILKKMDAVMLDEVVTRYVRLNRFPPTIADLQTGYQDIINERMHQKHGITELYRQMLNYYPQSLQDENKGETFKEVIEDRDTEKMYRNAVKVTNKVIDYVRRVERGEVDILPFISDCIRRCAE